MDEKLYGEACRYQLVGAVHAPLALGINGVLYKHYWNEIFLR